MSLRKPQRFDMVLKGSTKAVSKKSVTVDAPSLKPIQSGGLNSGMNYLTSAFEKWLDANLTGEPKTTKYSRAYAPKEALSVTGMAEVIDIL